MKIGDVSLVKDKTGRSIAFFCKDSSQVITKNFFYDLQKWSRDHNDQDVRICLHQDKQDVYHQMIILHHKGTYHRPHKETRAESYHIIQGEMMICLFNSKGKLRERIILHADRTPLYRLSAGIWHMSIPLTPIVIFDESKSGPYTGSEIEFAQWAPSEEKLGLQYTKQLVR